MLFWTYFVTCGVDIYGVFSPVFNIMKKKKNVELKFSIKTSFLGPLTCLEAIHKKKIIKKNYFLFGKVD